MTALIMITVFWSILFLSHVPIVELSGTAAGVQFLISTHDVLNTSVNSTTPDVYLQLYADYSPRPVEVEISMKCFNVTNSPMERKINLTTTYTELIPRPKLKSGDVPVIHITASSPVAVFVTVSHGDRAIETFRAVPVSGWGRRYHAVTLGFRYSLIILTYLEPNNVTVRFRSANPEGLTFNLNGFNILNDKELPVTLHRYKGFAVSKCSSSRCEGSITGTKIVGEKPIGVITGNCRSVDDNMACNSQGRKGENYIAEMLMPQETFGKQFILFQPHNRFEGSYCVVVAGTDNTTVRRYRTLQNRTTDVIELSEVIQLNKEGDWEIIDDYLVEYINSTTGFMVMSPVGLSTIDYVVCVEEYISSSDLTVENHNPNVTVDVMDKTKVTSLKVQGNLLWKVIYFEIMKVARFIIFSTTSTFGCYQYGIGKNTSYMHPAGFISSPINTKCEKSILVMNHLDIIDNDCDGRLDEELANHKDDDGDQLIDEDVNAFAEYKHNPHMVWKALPKDLKNLSTKTTSTSGSTTSKSTKTTTVVKTVRPRTEGPTTLAPKNRTTFKPPTAPTVRITLPENANIVRHPWTEWHCSTVCGDPSMHRERNCVDISKLVQVAVKCDTETKPGYCFHGIVCPGECALFKWGLACNKTCFNCEDHCDKFLGSCTLCKPGFRDPKSACVEECDQFHYGRNCEDKCLEKCGGQCIDSVSGVCPHRKSIGKILSYIIVILIPAGAVGIYLFQRLQNNRDEPELDDDDLFAMSQTQTSVKVDSDSVDDFGRKHPTSSSHSRSPKKSSSKILKSPPSAGTRTAKSVRSTNL